MAGRSGAVSRASSTGSRPRRCRTLASRAESTPGPTWIGSGVASTALLCTTVGAVLEMDQAQALEGQLEVDLIDHVGELRDRPGLAPGGDHPGGPSELVGHPPDHALDLADEAPEQPRLDGRG